MSETRATFRRFDAIRIAAQRIAAAGARLLTDADSGQAFVHPATTHGVLIELMTERHGT